MSDEGKAPLWGTKAWFDQLAQTSNKQSPSDYYSYASNGYQKVRIKNSVTFVSASSQCNRNSVLDVGCATGDLLKAISEQVNIPKVVGIDFSEKVIEQARMCLPEADFQVQSFPGLGVAELFDTVFLFEVLYYVPQARRVEAIKELKGVLNSDGRIFLSSSVLGEPYLTEEEIFTLVVDSGLRIERMKRMDFRCLFKITSPLEKIYRIINTCDSASGKKGFYKKLMRVGLGNKIIRPLINVMVDKILASEKLANSLSRELSSGERELATHVYLELRV